MLVKFSCIFLKTWIVNTFSLLLIFLTVRIIGTNPIHTGSLESTVDADAAKFSKNLTFKAAQTGPKPLSLVSYEIHAYPGDTLYLEKGAVLIIVIPLYHWVLYLKIQPTMHQKIFGKITFQKVPKRQNCSLSHAGNYLHSIYILFTLYYK